jgi:L-fuconolactonase
MRIDSHQHFWKYQPVRDAWITDDMKVIQRDFLPADLWPLLQQNNVDGCVAVQADQSEAETDFLLSAAAENDWIKGIVGWVDLRAADLEERLEHYKKYPKLKGFRHVLQAEQADDFILDKGFCQGISMLSTYHFTYDILVYPKQLKYVAPFVRQFPDQAFVIDHLAKPDLKNGGNTDWEKDIKAAAAYPNVYCKVSGMVTEADWKNWQPDDFTQSLDIVTEAFGISRLLFGSDWPVCGVSASYQEVCNVAHRYFMQFSIEDQEKFWGKNAVEFYHL